MTNNNIIIMNECYLTVVRHRQRKTKINTVFLWCLSIFFNRFKLFKNMVMIFLVGGASEKDEVSDYCFFSLIEIIRFHAFVKSVMSFKAIANQ